MICTNGSSFSSSAFFHSDSLGKRGFGSLPPEKIIIAFSAMLENDLLQDWKSTKISIDFLSLKFMISHYCVEKTKTSYQLIKIQMVTRSALFCTPHVQKLSTPHQTIKQRCSIIYWGRHLLKIVCCGHLPSRLIAKC